MRCEPNDLAVCNRTCGDPAVERYLLGIVFKLGSVYRIDEVGAAQWQLVEPHQFRLRCDCGARNCINGTLAYLFEVPDCILTPIRDSRGIDESLRLAHQIADGAVWKFDRDRLAKEKA